MSSGGAEAEDSGGRRCGGCLGLALALDGAGLLLLLAGAVFASVAADLLIYAGGVCVFGSLLGWVSWYVGNLEVPPAELCDDVGLTGRAPRKVTAGRLAGLVRALSGRFSSSGGAA